jgi:hypothetical protein
MKKSESKPGIFIATRFFYLENKVGYKKALAYFLVSSAVSCMAAIIVLVFFFDIYPPLHIQVHQLL